eukprot:1615992-Lingulodinium_polyedra.AAC.1
MFPGAWQGARRAQECSPGTCSGQRRPRDTLGHIFSASVCPGAFRGQSLARSCPREHSGLTCIASRRLK